MCRFVAGPRPLNCAALILVLIACGDEPLSPGGDTEPQVENSGITVDFGASMATFVLDATDPNGPVAITCTGAFPVTGTDAISVDRPLADVRLTPDAATTCVLEQGGAQVEHTVTYGGPGPLDGVPSSVNPRPADVMRTGAPVRLVVGGSDDWQLTSYDIQWAAGETTVACDAPTGDAAGTFGAAAAPPSWPEWRDTVVVEFGSAGPHCLRLTVRDDAGHVSSRDSVYMVGTAEPPLLPPASIIGEYTGRPLYEQTHVWLNLAVEDAGAEIAGFWVMHYSITTASDEGSFTGAFENGVLTLALSVASGCAGSYTLTGRALDSDGDYWTFDVAPTGGCWSYATGPLTVVRQEDVPWFP